MGFSEVFRSSWKLYTLHWRAIATIVCLCSFVPFILLMLASPGVAQLLGVTGTLAEYHTAQTEYGMLVKASFSGAVSESSQQAIQMQLDVLSDLQSQLLPYFASIGGLFLVVGLVGLLGMFALLIGFFGKFGSAFSLLREARSRYWVFVGTIFATLFIGLLGLIAVCVSVVILALAVTALTPISPVGGLIVGTIGGVALLVLSLYLLMGLLFTPYEALARKTFGFGAVRGAWHHVKGKRSMIIGYSLLFCICMFVCFLPLFILQGIFALQTFALGVQLVSVVTHLVVMFVMTPLMYLFYGFLYKKLV